MKFDMTMSFLSSCDKFVTVTNDENQIMVELFTTYFEGKKEASIFLDSDEVDKLIQMLQTIKYHMGNNK